jgi:hypothetical protein
VWWAVAGSERGAAEARAELELALKDPEGALAAKLAHRRRLAHRSIVSLPADPLLE